MDELEELESEFVRFLASQSIVADDWTTMKTKEPEKAEGLLDIFSNLVFEKVLKDVEYLELRQKQALRVFKVLDDRIQMIGLLANGETALDFTRQDQAQEMLAKHQASGGKIQLFKGEKKFDKLKEDAIFRVMEEGALISKTADLYKQLEGMLPK